MTCEAAPADVASNATAALALSHPVFPMLSPFASIRLEKAGKLLDDRAAELLDVHDRYRAAVIPRDVMPNADGDELDRGLLLDPVDHLAQVHLQVTGTVHAEC